MSSVLQPWVEKLSFMKQSVLITSVRGPDTLHKNHIAKMLCRWLRRSFMLVSFTGEHCWRPDNRDKADDFGGSFTGPSYIYTGGKTWHAQMDLVVAKYLSCVDEVPLHFHLHLIHSAEILGRHHPAPEVRTWWAYTYDRLVRDMHLMPEPQAALDKRLGDNQQDWLDAEEVTAEPPRE